MRARSSSWLGFAVACCAVRCGGQVSVAGAGGNSAAAPSSAQAGGGKCNPRSCPALGVSCGPSDDGCGKPIDCGGCPPASTACLVASCTAGKCVGARAALGTACNDNGGKACNGLGKCVVLGPLCGPGLQPGAPWPMSGRCQSHASLSPFAGAHTPTLQWSRSLSWWSSPVIAADGTLYLGAGASEDRHLYALNPDGTSKWALLAGGGLGTPAIGADGTVYVGSLDQKLYAINPDGTQKWTLPTGSDLVFWRSVTIGADGTMYLPTRPGGIGSAKLLAITPAGAEKWAFSPGDADGFSAPVIAADGTIYSVESTASAGKLYAIAPDGTIQWSVSLAGGDKLAIGPDGTVYVGGSGLDAIRPDGTHKWVNDVLTGQSLAIGPDGTVYVTQYQGVGDNLHALTPDGKELWASLPLVERATPAIGADGVIYAIFATDFNVSNWELHALKPNGTKLWSVPIGNHEGSGIAIGADGTVYVSAGTTLYAIGP